MTSLSQTLSSRPERRSRRAESPLPSVASATNFPDTPPKTPKETAHA